MRNPLAMLSASCLTFFFCHCRVDRNKYQIQIPLPPKIDPSVTMMTVEEKPDVTYNDVGGCKEQIEKMREVKSFKFHLTSYIIMKLCSTKFLISLQGC